MSVSPFMENLTLMFVVGTVIVYMIQVLLTKRQGIELPAFTLVLGICAIATILTDETIKGDMIGLLILFPVIFAILQSIIKIIWGRA